MATSLMAGILILSLQLDCKKGNRLVMSSSTTNAGRLHLHVTGQNEMKVIRRDDIPTLRSVVVDGEEHNLGILKDFRKHPDLAAFIPEHSRLSMAGVHLEPEEVLAIHAHPTGSHDCHGFWCWADSGRPAGQH